jgi:hypothetical protein
LSSSAGSTGATHGKTQLSTAAVTENGTSACVVRDCFSISLDEVVGTKAYVPVGIFRCNAPMRTATKQEEVIVERV